MNDVNDRYENEIDLLIDGELTDERRRYLLLSCENEPDRWRDVALSFVESQIMRKEMKGILADSEPSLPTSSQLLQNRMRHSWLNRPWALAAAVLVSIGTGFGLGAFFNSLESHVPAMARREGVRVGAAADSRHNEMTNSGSKTVQLVVSEPNSNQLLPVEVPLVPVSRIDEWANALPQDFLPEDVRQTLQQLGHDVRHKRQFIPVELPDGSRALVPVDNVSVDYLGDFQ